MPELVLPDVRYRESFLAAMEEFVDEGRRGDGSMVGDDIRDHEATWSSPEGFADYVALLRRDGVLPRRPGWVTTQNFFWVEGEEYLGRIALRHPLNEMLRTVGGHVGYDVRRSARRRGHASAMLASVLPVAAELGIDRVLVTCDLDNVASRRVIEANGGIPDGQAADKLRFWVPTR